MNKDSRIYVAGHTGMVGSAIVRRLQTDGYTNIVTYPRHAYDFRWQSHVEEVFMRTHPEYVFLAAAKVGGIAANDSLPADFIEINLLINASMLRACYQFGVKRTCYLGSSCIYPRNCFQPIKEEFLLTGPLEPTNQWYAIAKIAGLKLCEAYHLQYGFDYVAPMPTNLYGPGDKFDNQSGHVIPALMHRLHQARCQNLPAVNVWGTGTARREFLHVDDCASACVALMNSDYCGLVNVGSGLEHTINFLAKIIAKVVDYKGELRFDATRPDGTPRKLLDCTLLHRLGWRHRIGLLEGLEQTYQWYLENEANKNEQ